MRIAFVVNDVDTEEATYTTTRLGMAAANLGHDSFLFGVGDFIYSPDGTIHALARRPREAGYDSLERFLGELQSEDGRTERIAIDEIDVVMLRNDPSTDAAERPWAQTAGVLFGELAAARGTLVVNDPQHLATAINKTYFQHFPEDVRPRTCISRNPDEVKRFIAEQGGIGVIKPLQGSGGKNVFVIAERDQANVNQMIEAVTRDGYCVAQEFLPAAAKGDVRMFVMNGHPLTHDGKYAAFRRVSQNGDARSNMHSGGKSQPAEITDRMLEIVEIVSPKLIADGMFLVGLDIVEDKLIEINVFSPGGLGSCQQFTGADFAEIVIQELERKTRLNQGSRPLLSNAELATCRQLETTADAR
jgi:glutathione synthase